MSSLVELFSVDFVSFTILQYLNCSSRDIFHLKLTSSYFESLVNTMVPVHNFMSILHCLSHKIDPKIDLHIPRDINFMEHILCCRALYYFVEKFGANSLCNLITKFIIKYYEHDFCVQVVNSVYFNYAFLFKYIQQNEQFGKSTTAKQILTVHRLANIINSSTFEKVLKIDSKWVEETEWDINWLLVHVNELTLLTFHFYKQIEYIESETRIFENKALTLFLLYFLFHSTQQKEFDKFTDKLINSSKWNHEYKYEMIFKECMLNCTHKLTEVLAKDVLEVHKVEDISDAKRLLSAKSSVMQYLPPILYQNKQFVLHAIRRDSECFLLVHPQLKQDKDVILAAMRGYSIETNARLAKHILSLYADDIPFLKQIFVECTHWNDKSIFPDWFMEDRNLILERVHRNKYAIELLKDTKWLYDKEIVNMLLDWDLGCYSYLPTSIRSDNKIIFKALRSRGNLRHVPKEVTITKEMVMLAAKTDLFPLKEGPEQFREDEEVVLQTIWFNAGVFQSLSETLRNNKEFVRKCIGVNGCCLEYVNAEFQQDRELIIMALQQNAFIFNRIKALQNDEEFYQIALQFYSS